MVVTRLHDYSNFNLKSPRKKKKRKSISNNSNENVSRSNEARNSISPASNDLFGGRAPSPRDEDNFIHDNEPNLNQIYELIETTRSNHASININNPDIADEVNSNLNIIPGIPLITPLIDIPFSQMGCLIGISNSVFYSLEPCQICEASIYEVPQRIG